MILGAGSDPADPAPAVRNAVRYRAADLDAWIESRLVDPATQAKPRYLSAPPHVLTDAQWRAVEEAMIDSHTPLGFDRRAMIDALLHVAATGAWPPLPPGTGPWYGQIDRSLSGHCWLIKAFDALRAFPDVPAVLAVQTVIVYRRPLAMKSYTWRLKTDAYGPPRGKTHRNLRYALDGAQPLPKD